MLAPIAIFTYKRPRHTDMMLYSLVKNPLAKDSDVFIFIDGAKKDNERYFQSEIEKVCYKHKDYFKNLEIIKRSINFGLSRNIPEGITEILNNYEKIIVLEEDLYLSPYFLKFMNDALEFYASEGKVMHVSAYTLPIKKRGLPDTFFIRPTTCWGWATWKRSWHFERDPVRFFNSFTKDQIHEFNVNGMCNLYFDQLISNAKNETSTWAVFWYISVFLRGGLSLHPKYSYSRNLGFKDGLGESSLVSSIFEVDIYNKPLKFTKDISINPLANKYWGEFCKIGPHPYPKDIFDFLIFDKKTHQYWKENFGKDFGILRKPRKNMSLNQVMKFYHFKELFDGLNCYLKKSKDLDITISKAKNLGCLSKNTFALNENWTTKKGWLGRFGDGFGVGIVGSFDDIKPIVDKYGLTAREIYFPYPEKYKEDSSKEGQLLMLF